MFCALFLWRMKSITGQWLGKHATFRHESFERAWNVRLFPGPAALLGIFFPPCAILGSRVHYSDGLGNSSRKHNLAVVLTYVPLFARTSAALTRPSSPGRTRVMRPRTKFPSTTNTRSPVARFRTSPCHFHRSVRDGTYSRSQRFQKWLVITWACLHLFLHWEIVACAAN